MKHKYILVYHYEDFDVHEVILPLESRLSKEELKGWIEVLIVEEKNRTNRASQPRAYNQVIADTGKDICVSDLLNEEGWKLLTLEEWFN